MAFSKSQVRALPAAPPRRGGRGEQANDRHAARDFITLLRWWDGGLAALSAAARHIDASLAIVGAQRWPEAGPRKYGNVSWTPSRQAD